MNRLAKEYNAGLAEAQKQAREHNEKVLREFRDVGVVKASFLKTSLVPIPQPCPEELDARWVSKFMSAFSWKRAARNTAGQYLASWPSGGDELGLVVSIESYALWHDPYIYIYMYLYMYMYIFIYIHVRHEGMYACKGAFTCMCMYFF